MMSVIVVFLIFVFNIYWCIRPPKDISNTKGYSTSLSKKSQEHWDIANTYAPKIFLFFSFAAATHAIYSFFRFGHDNPIVVFSLLVIGAALMHIMTERKLKRFTEQPDKSK